MRRYKSRLTGDALRKFFREKWTLAIRIQSNYRAYKARELYKKLQINYAVSYYAARDIQRIYRGSRILHWKDMRLNLISAFCLDRHYIERRTSMIITKLRYHRYVQDNQKDSASEPDDDIDDAAQWIKNIDHDKNLYYWQNFITNQIVYDEPPDLLAHEKDLVGKRVKIFWIVQVRMILMMMMMMMMIMIVLYSNIFYDLQNTWYEGTIRNYHRRKNRHRVDYDDGDHEWINLQQECERVQVQMDDGLWVMYTMYQSGGI